MKKLTKLEAIRGFAALYVVLGHTFSDVFSDNKAVSIIFRFGQEAVIVFFLLSGFVIQYAYHYSKDKSFASFFRKRFLRIYIPLFIVFIANYLILCVERGSFFAIDTTTLTGNIFMVQDTSFVKPNVLCDPFLGNLPLWSLSYEWWFYMLFFLMKKFFRERSSSTVYALALVAAVTYLVYPNFANRLFLYLLIWWSGVELSNLYINRIVINFLSIRKLFFMLLFCVAILSLNVYLNYAHVKAQLGGRGTLGESPLLELRHFTFAVVAILFAILWNRYGWVFFSRTIGVFEPLAPISFGIYISHWFLIAKARYLDNVITNSFFRYGAYFLICLLFAYLVERVIYVYLNNHLLRLSKLIQPVKK